MKNKNYPSYVKSPFQFQYSPYIPIVLNRVEIRWICFSDGLLIVHNAYVYNILSLL